MTPTRSYQSLAATPGAVTVPNWSLLYPLLGVPVTVADAVPMSTAFSSYTLSVCVCAAVSTYQTSWCNRPGRKGIVPPSATLTFRIWNRPVVVMQTWAVTFAADARIVDRSTVVEVGTTFIDMVAMTVAP
jgi:hypothetical protein